MFCKGIAANIAIFYTVKFDLSVPILYQLLRTLALFIGGLALYA